MTRRPPVKPGWRGPPAVVLVTVLLLHAGALLALGSGLLQARAPTPVAMLVSRVVTPPQAIEEPAPLPVQPAKAPTPPPKLADAPLQKPPAAPLTPPPDAPKAPTATAPATPSSPAPPNQALPMPMPMPLALANPAPGAQAPTGAAAQSLAATGGGAASPQAAAGLATGKVELPISDADYLNNPPPPYPALSSRLGEQGKVMLRVYIGADGAAQKGDVRTSSGFTRLDTAALAAALRWRYAPGKRGGQPEAMWVNVPVNFTLPP